jgi:hypothetical protein
MSECRKRQSTGTPPGQSTGPAFAEEDRVIEGSATEYQSAGHLQLQDLNRRDATVREFVWDEGLARSRRH